MPEDNKTNQTPDVPWQDLSFKFDGQWMPDMDSTLIGPTNYQTLQNLRYTDDSLECVSGYRKVNPTAIGATVKIANGHQLQSSKTQTSYTLVQGILAATGQGTVYCNRVAPGTTSTTDFDHQAAGTAHRLDTSGNEYRTDSSANLQGRFSEAPQGNIAYCNGEESTIFGGDEQGVAACFSIEIGFGAELIDEENDRTFGGASNWENVDWNSYDETTGGVLTLAASVAGQYCRLPVADAPTVAGSKYRLTYTSSEVTGGCQVHNYARTQYFGSIYGAETGGTFDFVANSGGGIALTANSSSSAMKFDNFSLKQLEPVNQLDTTNKVINTLYSAGDDDTYFTWDQANNNAVYVFTTRPIQAVKFYVGSANVSASTLSGFVSAGNGKWDALSLTDGTRPATVALAQTGVVSFTHTASTAKPMHFEELYLYAYYFTLSAGSAAIYHITVDPGMQKIVDVWDGVYRQPIQFQILDGTTYFDYTLQVQESSDLNAPIGALLDGLTSSDKIYIMFEDQMSAIKFTMLGDLVNAATETISLKYWNGSSFTDIFIEDGTLTSGTTSFSTTGLVAWAPPSDEEPQTLFGSYGYVYEFSLTGTLTGTKGTDVTTEGGIEVIVDICTGVPAQVKVPAFDWSASYGSRLMLCSYSKGNEGNRMDYSVSNAPDVWNGFDSSDNGKQSLYFGGNEKIVAGTQIYNRFGANVYSMLLVLKQKEVYILVGDTPEEFTIYPVAKTIGCVSPLTLATAEIGIDLGGGLTRNIAMWVSHSGPMMFDGAVLVPINGIGSYFDPTDSKYIKFSLMDTAVGWFDAAYKEYNICIPSGSSATTNNTWLVFDLAKRKWFEKVCLASHFPQCGFDVINPSTGQRYNYAGKSDGFMVQLETGTYWDDGASTGIAQSVTTGDFYPTNNMWDVTTLRKHKLLATKVTEVSATTNTGTIKHYLDTEEEAYTVGTFDLANVKGTQKLVRVVNNMNKTGVQHAFNYSVTTTNVDKGLQPISWGVQFRTERKDNTAT